MTKNNDLFSMTGFGKGEASFEGRTITVEAKSVNQRFLDVRVRLPREIAGWDAEFVRAMKKKFSRGKIEFYLSIDADQKDAQVNYNLALARGYKKALDEIADDLDLPDKATIEVISRFSDIFSAKIDEEKLEQLKKVALEAMDAAANAMIEMRREEGEFLRQDLLERGRMIEKNRAKIDDIAPTRIERFRKTLQSKIDDLISSSEVDPGRLEQEIVLYADRCDVTEELVRLTSHLGLWNAALAEGGSIGRKLDFLCQEINREINTIGSKSNDGSITELVVEMKVELEKMREQVQNIE